MSFKAEQQYRHKRNLTAAWSSLSWWLWKVVYVAQGGGGKIRPKPGTGLAGAGLASSAQGSTRPPQQGLRGLRGAENLPAKLQLYSPAQAPFLSFKVPGAGAHSLFIKILSPNLKMWGDE